MNPDTGFEPTLTLPIGFEQPTERFSASDNQRQVGAYDSAAAAPFIKWAGGKRNILHELLARLPVQVNDYYEPFLGGGALFFGMHNPLRFPILSDSNLELVITYKVVRKEPEPLITQLTEHSKKHSKEYYYRIRKQHELRDPIKIAARFIYLNKTCYNGLYRVNKAGRFNVPMGQYTSPSIFSRDNLLGCHASLQAAKVEFRDFDTIRPAAGDFVYCDPPYHPLDATSSFTGYTKQDFGPEDQIRLRDFALKLHKQGVRVMISNSDTGFINGLYAQAPFKVDTIQAPRFVNSKPSRRDPINELLITTY